MSDYRENGVVIMMETDGSNNNDGQIELVVACVQFPRALNEGCRSHLREVIEKASGGNHLFREMKRTVEGNSYNNDKGKVSKAMVGAVSSYGKDTHGLTYSSVNPGATIEEARPWFNNITSNLKVIYEHMMKENTWLLVLCNYIILSYVLVNTTEEGGEGVINWTDFALWHVSDRNGKGECVLWGWRDWVVGRKTAN